MPHRQSSRPGNPHQQSANPAKRTKATPSFKNALTVAHQYAPSSSMKAPVVILSVVRLCPGKRHAWYNSPVGLIRKPVKRVVVA